MPRGRVEADRGIHGAGRRNAACGSEDAWSLRCTPATLVQASAVAEQLEHQIELLGTFISVEGGHLFRVKRTRSFPQPPDLVSESFLGLERVPEAVRRHRSEGARRATGEPCRPGLTGSRPSWSVRARAGDSCVQRCSARRSDGVGDRGSRWPVPRHLPAPRASLGFPCSS